MIVRNLIKMDIFGCYPNRNPVYTSLMIQLLELETMKEQKEVKNFVEVSFDSSSILACQISSLKTIRQSVTGKRI